MNDAFLRDDTSLDESKMYFRVKVAKSWFRGKDVFANRLSFYERQLLHEDEVVLPLNAGNMIYIMMQRLEVGVDWDKQSALMLSYRNLVYRLSYTRAVWYKSDLNYIVLDGQKSDVMWTLSFVTQVFFDEPMSCVSIPCRDKEQATVFSVQNGKYVGANAVISGKKNALPDIWSAGREPVVTSAVFYNPDFEPSSGDIFAIPDDRVAQYVRMDERFYTANKVGTKVDMVMRHNITASIIKDFEDLIRKQTQTPFDVYQLRYEAYMNKVHELEEKLGGLEPTAYDVLPIGERGLPLASSATIRRTNAMDQNSLRYIYDSFRNGGVEKEDIVSVAKDAMRSLKLRQQGYETEYRMYLATGTPEETASKIFRKMIVLLYRDFALLDTLGVVKFPVSVYRNLCNVPSSGGPVMTDWERQRVRLFGKGYLDFLNKQIALSKDKAPSRYRIWMEAKRLVYQRFINAPKK